MNAPGRTTRTRRRARRGSTYVLVLMTVFIVTLLGASSIMMARLNLNLQRQMNESDEAELLATTGVERALAYVETNDLWPYWLNHDTPSSTKSIGNGTFFFTISDESGDDDLTSDGPFRVVGTGMVGDAVRMQSVLLSQNGPPLEVLTVGTFVDNRLEFHGGAVVTSTRAIGANALVKNGPGGSTVYPTMESATGFDVTGPGATVMIDPRDVPDATVLDDYITAGTPIDVSDIPSNRMENILLSPSHNPYGAGATNPNGIYVLDMQGGKGLQIERCRIVGTLVVFNAGGGKFTIVRQSVFEPAVPNYPTLLVDGDLELSLGTNTLSEGSIGVNFNPTGAPWEGNADVDLTDTYDPAMNGLVYTSGKLEVRDDLSVKGLMIAVGTTHFHNDVDIVYDNRYAQNPPPGFVTTDGPLVAVPGSWRWEVNP